jgi:hypothetical protein
MTRTGARLVPIYVLSLALLACGGSTPDAPDAGDAPDATVAPPDAGIGSCGATVGTIDGVDDTFSGTLAIADGPDFDVAMGECANEVSYYMEVGPDEVVAVTGLEPGTSYTAILSGPNDYAVYVVTDCDADGPAPGECLAFTDVPGAALADVALFDAPASGEVFLVIDVFGDQLLGDGAYTLTVTEPECETTPDCAEGTCINYQCVECVTSFDCDADAPICTPTGCAAGFSECTADDAADDGPGGDDGPSAATAITPVPVAGTPTSIDAAICSAPAQPREEDWYSFTTIAAGSWTFVATWTATADIDFQILDAAGLAVASGGSTAPSSETVLTPELAAGTYYVRVIQFGPAGATAAIAYTLAVGVPECTTSFDCTDPTTPVCSGAVCVAGPDGCTGDDVADTTGDDDGPAGASVMPATTVWATGGSICNVSADEVDYYAFDVVQSAGLTLQLDWVGSPDLDLNVFDAEGTVFGGSVWAHPEIVTLDYLPAGRYYASVRRFGTASASVDAYTLLVTVGAASACTSAADCDDTYSTQLLRGVCTAGACEAIPAGAGAVGAACDSNADCGAAPGCSYTAFEADGGESVCTLACVSDGDCTTLGADFRCSLGAPGFAGRCMTSCASDLDCGAMTGSSAIDVGQPWNYGACNVTTGVCTY